MEVINWVLCGDEAGVSDIGLAPVNCDLEGINKGLTCVRWEGVYYSPATWT